MTAEELREYNNLTPAQKDAYNMGMKHHPEWSHRQAHTYAIIVTQPIDPGKGKPIDIFREMVKQADRYMEVNFPSIYPQVKETFKNVYSYVSNVVSTTWDAIVNFFKNL